MANKQERQKRRRERERIRQKIKQQVSISHPEMSQQVQSDEPYTKVDQQQNKPSLLAFVVRMVGFSPILFLIVMLGLPNNLYFESLPNWFHSILDQQVAILTLCAGQSAIIGLMINNRDRIIREGMTFSTYTLFVAAGATALAGYRAIGDSTSGHVVIMTLFISFFPAVWAEPISIVIKRLWNSVTSKKGLAIIGLIVFVISVMWNQYQDENYIRNWLLIPFGVLLGIIVSVALLWLVLEISIRWIPRLWTWLIGKVRGAYNYLNERFRGKGRSRKD